MFEAVTVGAVGTVTGAIGRLIGSNLNPGGNDGAGLDGIGSNLNPGGISVFGTVARGASPGESRDKG